MFATCFALTVSLALPNIDVRRIDSIAKSYVSNRQFSGVALVARKGQILFHRAYGMANWDLRRPNTTSTKFRLGSITKQFTAAAILLLEEQGKLRLDDPIARYFPDAPPSWQGITIKHLLHHESGIPDITGLPDYQVFKRLEHSGAALRKHFSDLPLQFEPGTKHRYSNSGYVLLGQIIEKGSSESYSDAMSKMLFQVAGMRDTGCDSTSAIIPNRATGYIAGPKDLLPAPFIDMTVPFGAGNLVSTTHDLLLWESCLFGGRLLKPSSLAKMVAPLKGITPSATGIGMGLAIDETYGRRQIFFGGGIEGFNSWLAYDPADGTVVILLSNITTPWLEDMAGQLGAVARGAKVVLTSERKEIQIPAEVLQKYVGAYVISPTENMNIGLKAGRLFVQVDGQSPFTLYTEGAARFFLRELDAQAEFIANDRGSFDLLWTQGGTTLRAPRK